MALTTLPETQCAVNAENAMGSARDFRNTASMEATEWIKRGLKTPGKSQRGLAEALGIDPAGVNRLLKGTRILKAHEVQRIAAYLEVAPPAELVGVSLAPLPVSDADLTRPHTDGLVGDRDLPVYGSAQGGPDGEMIITFEPIETVRRPAPLEGVHGGFGFYMVGESMSPVYEPGDMILCHPTRPPYAGQDVLVIRQHNGSQCALVKRLVRIDDHGLRLRQFNPPDDGLCVAREDVVSFHLVVGKYNRR